MTLHMIRLAPDLPRLTRWAERQGLFLARREDDFGYALHAALAATFGELAPHPFALHTARHGAELLGYTPHDGEAMRRHAQSFADPDIAEAVGLASFAAKQMPASFVKGERFGFAVRVRPTIRTDRAGERNHVVERDAFAPPDADASPADGPTRGEVYQGWLAARLAAGGARMQRAVMEQFRRALVLRRDKERRLRAVDGPDAAFSGELEVTDAEAFAGLLAHGVGRHGAFGFGMLLLRPPARMG